MKWILWREYRLSRPILIAGLVLLLIPYVIVLIALCWPGNARIHGVALIGAAACYSVILSQLTLALLGGNAFAGERTDRSAEFVAYLPLSRLRRLVAKLSVTLATVILIWGVNLLVLLIILQIILSTNPELMSELSKADSQVAFGFGAGYTAITGLVFFGVGWLVSSLQSSPTFAVCGGLVTPLLIYMGLGTAAWLGDAPDIDRFMLVSYAVICPVLAVVCFSIGTWYYLRRVEP